eukprot:2658752-Rhodomonas_salina.1
MARARPRCGHHVRDRVGSRSAGPHPGSRRCAGLPGLGLDAQAPGVICLWGRDGQHPGFAGWKWVVRVCVLVRRRLVLSDGSSK